MRCPYCDFSDSRVTDSRDVRDGIRRRRQCLGCQARFTTYERLQPAALFVIKKDGRRERFDHDKVLAGVRRAGEKRPLAADALEGLVDDIEAELYGLGRTEIPSRVVGDLVMRRLKTLDHIAYIRFASVYRDFADITALKEEIDTLMDGAAAAPQAGQLPLLGDDELRFVPGSHFSDSDLVEDRK